MSHFKQAENNQSSENLQIWMCYGCQAVHLKTGNLMLNFTKQEFAELTHAVMEIYQNEIGAIDISSFFNSLSDDEEILSSSTIV